ncbi:MAG: hypothetical protein U1F36_06505 [Planctomycetota bacterium]
MLSTCCVWMALMTIGLGPQEPAALSAAVAVEGSVELSPSAADEAAHAIALADLETELERRVVSAASRAKPMWLPDPIAQRIATGWLGRQDVSAVLRVVDRDRKVRDHGSFESYQTTLSVRHDERLLERMFAGLGRELRQRGTVLAAIGGGSVVLWGFLIFAYGWLDRLTRGYMPWRLRLTCGAMAFAAPASALLIL